MLVAGPMTFVVAALISAYGAAVFSVVYLAALWTVWGPKHPRRALVLSLVVGAVATFAAYPIIALSRFEYLRIMAVMVSGAWLATAVGAALMRAWGWCFTDTRTPFDAGSSTRFGQYGLQQMLIVTVAVAGWLAALCWAYITGGDAATDGNGGVMNSLLLIVMLLINAPQVLIAAVTIGRARRVLIGLGVVLLLRVAAVVLFVVTSVDPNEMNRLLPFYVTYVFVNDLVQFCMIGLGMLLLRKRGYRLERSKTSANSPTTDAEKRMDGHD